MKTTTAPEICNALIDSFIGYFGTPIRKFCDQDSASYVPSYSMDFNILIVLM